MSSQAQLTPVSPYPAFVLTIGAEKTLVISDLHIGWEVALAEEGIHVPSQTARILEKVKNITALEKPDRLLVLGDVKHAVAKIELEEWRDVPNFFEEAVKIVPKVQVIPGNHDGDIEALLPEAVELSSPKGVILGDIGLFHGHSWPDVGLLGCPTLVVGHVHPVVAFKDPMGFRITRPVWVRAPCNGELLAKSLLRRLRIGMKRHDDPKVVLKTRFNTDLKTESLLIMPSFNDFLGGQTINQAAITRQRKFSSFIGPILRSGSANLEKAEAYLLDGTFLGSLDLLRKLS